MTTGGFMLNPEEKNRILNAYQSEKAYPLGSFYFVRVFNEISIFPYFLWLVIPVVSITLCTSNTIFFNDEINLRMSHFSINLSGEISNNILLLHDIYFIGIVLLTFFVIAKSKKSSFSEKFLREMKLLSDWFKDNNMPHKDIRFLRKTYMGGFLYIFFITLVLFFVYPDPSYYGLRVKVISNIYIYALVLNFFLFSCLLALSSIIVFYGVKRYVV